MFDGNEYWCNICQKSVFFFKNLHEEFSNFSPKHVEKSKRIDFGVVLLFTGESVWA